MAADTSRDAKLAVLLERYPDADDEILLRAIKNNNEDVEAASRAIGNALQLRLSQTNPSPPLPQPQQRQYGGIGRQQPFPRPNAQYTPFANQYPQQTIQQIPQPIIYVHYAQV